MREIVFASNNEGKVKEIKKMLKNYKVYSLKDLNINIDVEETGDTYLENALIKAKEIAKYTDKIILADDSGLNVDCLKNELGVKTARFMGKDTPYSEKIQQLTKMLNGVNKEERTARFTSVVACYIDEDTIFSTEGVLEGYILEKPIGEKGFAFDPIFYCTEKNKSNAQMTLEEKNEISHRGRAIKKMLKKLNEYFEGKNENENTFNK